MEKNKKRKPVQASQALVESGDIKPFTRDKYFDHPVSGAAISATVFAICITVFMTTFNVAAIAAMSSVFVAAVGKEFYDRYIKKTIFDLDDILFTLIGGGLPIAFMQILDMIFN